MKKQRLPIDGGPTFSLSHRLYRLGWNTTWFLLASWTPPFMRGWRCMLLRLFGAQIGAGCDVRASARVWYPRNLVMEARTTMADGVICYNVDTVTLQQGALVSQRAYLCTASHAIDDPKFPLTHRPIRLERLSWIASDAFVGPGVTAGEGSVLGARGVAFADLEAWQVYRGNPAQPLRRRKKIG